MAPIDTCLSFDYLVDLANSQALRTKFEDLKLGKRAAPSDDTHLSHDDEFCLFVGKRSRGSQSPQAELLHEPWPAAEEDTGPAQRVTEVVSLSSVVLGAGQYGEVRECTDLRTGEALACKTIRLDCVCSAELKVEARMMQGLQGQENVVQLRGVYEDEENMHLVMDLCRGGELYDEIVKREGFQEPDAAYLFAEIVRAVAFCHSRGVMHRDLKPENILLTRRLEAGVPLCHLAAQGPLLKLADFGLATSVEPGKLVSGVAGSPFYIAPEVLTGCYSTKADIWSLGVILYVLLSGSAPFWGSCDEATFQEVLYAEPDLTSSEWRGVSKEAKELLKSLLNKEPAYRPTAQSLLTHPWLLRQLAPKSFRRVHVPAAEPLAVGAL